MLAGGGVGFQARAERNKPTDPERYLYPGTALDKYDLGFPAQLGECTSLHGR